jgi:hypothetical protein
MNKHNGVLRILFPFTFVILASCHYRVCPPDNWVSEVESEATPEPFQATSVEPAEFESSPEVGQKYELCSSGVQFVQLIHEPIFEGGASSLWLNELAPIWNVVERTSQDQLWDYQGGDQLLLRGRYVSMLTQSTTELGEGIVRFKAITFMDPARVAPSQRSESFLMKCEGGGFVIMDFFLDGDGLVRLSRFDTLIEI